LIIVIFFFADVREFLSRLANNLILILTELNQIVSEAKKKASEGELAALTERLQRRLFKIRRGLIQIPVRKLRESNNQVFSFLLVLDL
jgi:hypothetical protein